MPYKGYEDGMWNDVLNQYSSYYSTELYKTIYKTDKNMATVKVAPPAKKPLDKIQGGASRLARDYEMSSKDGIMREWLFKGRNLIDCYMGIGHGNYVTSCTILSVLDPEFNCDIGIFTSPKYRKRGYAEELLLYVINKHPEKKFTCWVGDSESAEFFNRFLEKHPNTLLTTDVYTPAKK